MPADEREAMLEPLHGQPREARYIVCDIESKHDDTQEKGFTRPFLCGVYDGSHYHGFRDGNPEAEWSERFHCMKGSVDRAMRFMLSRRFCGFRIYAHNGGGFDFLFFLPWLMSTGRKLGYSFEVVPVNSSIQILKVTRKKQRWTFLDSYRLIPLGLDAAAKTFGLPGKQVVDLDMHESDPRWEEYNAIDCVQLFKTLGKFHEHIETVIKGEVGITAPSTAMRTFRRRYQRSPIHRNLDTHEFARTAYYGGRVERFRTKGRNLHYYDINSSYPTAMLEPMPVGEAFVLDGPGIPRSILGMAVVGFVHCDVEIPEDCYLPPLPVRTNKLIFPVGRFSGVWSMTELALLEHPLVGGRIVKVHKSVWYPAAPVFADMVGDLYRYRDRSLPGYDEGLDMISKLLLNSLYGKFGMRPERDSIYVCGMQEIPVGAVPANGDPDSLVWYGQQTTDAPYIIPQIAAHITTLSRVALWQVLASVLEKKGRIYYCDTDSIVTDIELETGSGLGKLKDEYPEGITEARFVASKMYALKTGGKWKIAAKGIPRDLKSIETIETLEGGGEIKFQRLEKIGALARAQFERGPRMLDVPRELKTVDDKRRLLASGDTRPLVLNAWQQ